MIDYVSTGLPGWLVDGQDAEQLGLFAQWIQLVQLPTNSNALPVVHLRKSSGSRWI